MKHILENSVSYFVDMNKGNFVRDSLSRKITSKNKKILNYYFSKINNLSSQFNGENLSAQERVERMKIFCDDLVKNKEILKQFPFFNDSFINMMLRFSKEEVWGVELSFSYFRRYFSSS